MKKLYALLVAALMFVVPFAQAAVPAGVETVFTSTATDFGTIVGYGWTLFLVIVGGLILFGIVRKVISKVAH
jgi:hypothetical protein